ncbi:hypothetical protein [Brachyspira pilosicoli]|uniref:hypothetical protein n=1 Tax=Brachyspira pilosicoli TaxID=52584 RepID=UPI0012F4796F|nr:hypothetical protein [Brachyspira pilosicoli]MBW5392004.1 hypothetical protein [Brachyspira pilosicoli]
MDREHFNILVNALITISGTLITSSVTIVGLFINNKSIKQKFENELKKKKNDLIIDKMSEAIKNILDLAVLSIRLCKVKTVEECDTISKLIDEKKLYYNDIFTYGSTEAVAILKCFNSVDNTNTDSVYVNICLYQLLLVQVRYDIMNIIVPPTSWIEAIISKAEFLDKKEKIIFYNNKLVDELGLNQEFKIK